MLPLKHILSGHGLILFMFPAREDAVTSGGLYLPSRRCTDGPREQETGTIRNPNSYMP